MKNVRFFLLIALLNDTSLSQYGQIVARVVSWIAAGRSGIIR